jgi:hypothetical protein
VPSPNLHPNSGKCFRINIDVEQEVEMKELFANKELMDMMKDKGWEPPTSRHYRDRTMQAEYHFSEVAFNEEFETQPRPL